MTDPVNPTPISALPPAPLITDTPEVFDDKAFPFAQSLDTLRSQANIQSLQTNQNAVAAKEGAATAVPAAASAIDSRDRAETAAQGATTINDFWQPRLLGAHPNFPTTDNQGRPLILGAEFFHTGITPNAQYVWNGTQWLIGTNVTAGVSQVNGKTGAVDLFPEDIAENFVQADFRVDSSDETQKWLSPELFRDGVLTLAPRPPELHFFGTDTTITASPGMSVLRFYAGGKGGDGGGGVSSGGAASGGGGGGFAFGDLEVSPGDVISSSIASGIVTISLNGDVVATANPGGNGVTREINTTTAPGGAGGTASISGAVSNGGAYSGGAGGSCPVITSGTSYSGAGGGIGGAGALASGSTGVGGGGAGEPGGETYGGGSAVNSGRGLLTAFVDPLLKHAIGTRGLYFSDSTIRVSPSPGAGGIAGAGSDFGGGGGGNSTVTTGSGGLMGGGGGVSAGGGSGTAGNGGYGGGGGGARSPSVSTGGAGGAAFCFFYF